MLTAGWRYSTGKPDIGLECYCWIVVVIEKGVERYRKKRRSYITVDFATAATQRGFSNHICKLSLIENLNDSARLNCLKSWEQDKRLTKSMYVTRKICQKFNGIREFFLVEKISKQGIPYSILTRGRVRTSLNRKPFVEEVNWL
jgi:hypothetical protein